MALTDQQVDTSSEIDLLSGEFWGGDFHAGLTWMRQNDPLHWDGRVSRVHALLECIRGAWLLADDGLSSNGTFCNDRRVRRRRLKDGDVLRLGSTTLVFRDPNDRPRDRTAVEP